MKKKINHVRFIAYLFILIETLGIAAFTILYFNNIFHTRDYVLPQYVIIGAATVVLLNALLLWIATLRISSYRHKTD